MKLDPEESAGLDELLDKALAEDIGEGDLTTELVMPEPKFAKARITARGNGVLAGIEVAEAVFKKTDKTLRVELLRSDGDEFEAGDDLMKIEGNGGSMLAAERCALNFLGRLCGIATLTSKFVDKVKGTGTVILDTRKTTPLFRSLEKYAVRAGGGTNHRMGLYDQVLVKENHASLVGGIEAAVRNIMGAVGKNRDIIKVIVEASNIEDAKTAAVRGVDRILLDNVTPEEAKKIRQEIPAAWALEVSGGINMENVREYAEVGIEYVSVGALTHSAGVVDLTLLFER